MTKRFGNRQRIEHALDAIAEIETYISDQTFDSFLANSMMRFACIKQLEVVGEACNHIDDTIKNKFADVEWRKVVGLRHVLVHEYFGVDATLVWDIVMNNIPNLKVQLADILADL